MEVYPKDLTSGKKKAIKYVGLLMAETSVKRGESVNAMIMLQNMSSESVNHCVKLFIKNSECSDWQLCSNKEYTFSPGEHLHAYLNIPCKFLTETDSDEILVFAGDMPPELDAQMRGVSDILSIKE